MKLGRYTVDRNAAAISIFANLFWAGLAGFNAVDSVDQYIDGDKTVERLETFRCLKTPQ